MDIVVIGATGVLGPSLLSRLVHDGHRVRALSRTRLAPTAAGVEPCQVDILDPIGLRAAIDGADAVINVASAIPRKGDPSPADWQANDRVRDRGTQVLLDAMDDRRIHRLVQASVHLVFGADRGDELLHEESHVAPGGHLASAVRAEERVAAAAAQRPLAWTILRFGWLHGQRSAHSTALLARLRAGDVTVPDARPWWWSTISDRRAADIAARAVADGEGWGVVHAADGPAVPVGALLAQVAARRSWPAPAVSPEGDRDLRRSVRMDVSRLVQLGIPLEDPVSALAATARSLDPRGGA